MEEIAGVAVVPLIVGVVEVVKQAGLAPRWAPLLAVGLGVAIGVSYRATVGVVEAGGVAPVAWVTAVLGGLAWGLAATGLYSGARAVAPSVVTARPPERG